MTDRYEDLLPCRCGGSVAFHSDDDCDGCHYIHCESCGAMVDYSGAVDPGNDCGKLEALRALCAERWNRRATTGMHNKENSMTPEVERKRRELFEETLSSKYSPAIGWHERDGKGYLLPCIQDQWIGFNAALDTVCIELPDVRSATDIAYFNAGVIDAITDTGLGLRIK